MASLRIHNAQIYNRDGEWDCLVVDGKIAKIAEHISESADSTIDATGLMMIPGAIDMHVHFRVPGNEEKETWKTGSAAALAGGVTTVCDMPNNIPSITTRALLEEKIAWIQRDAEVRFGCYIGATNDNVQEIIASQDIACGVKVYHGASTGDMLMNDPEVLKTLFQANLSIPIVIHAEDEATIFSNTEKYKEYTGKDIHTKIRSREAAIRSLNEVLLLAEGTQVKLHITHVSTKEEIEMIRNAKKTGLDITCDVTPHHLAFNSDDVERLGHRLRVNPPIREKQDNRALWEALCDGTIDMVATDHAPHLRSEKMQDNYWNVPSGVPGVETMLPFLLDKLSAEFTFERLVEVTATMPAQRFNFVDRGVIEEGKTADIVLVDVNKTTSIEAEKLRTKCGWSPWEGETFHGAVRYTILDGEVQVTQ